MNTTERADSSILDKNRRREFRRGAELTDFTYLVVLDDAKHVPRAYGVCGVDQVGVEAAPSAGLVANRKAGTIQIENERFGNHHPDNSFFWKFVCAAVLCMAFETPFESEGVVS